MADDEPAYRLVQAELPKISCTTWLVCTTCGAWYSLAYVDGNPFRCVWCERSIIPAGNEDEPCQND